MNPKYAHLFTKDGRVNTASIRGDRLNPELRAEIKQQYSVYTKLSHKLRAIKNGGYFHCYVCGAITEPSTSVNREKLYCSKACVNACPDRASRAKALYQTHKDKRTKTNQERYGADTPFDSPSVQAKVKPTIQAKYGVSNIARLDEVKRKKEQTYQERYGVSSPLQAEQFKVKAFNTMAERYGGHYMSSNTHASTLAQAKFHYVSSLGVSCTPQELDGVTIGLPHKPISKELIMAKLGQAPLTAELIHRNYAHPYPQLHQYGLIEDKSTTLPHRIVMGWLDALGVEYVVNTRKIIAPQELDIYIPAHNLAIEINGVYWHDSFNGTPRTYHASKCNACESKGIHLLQFWDFEILNQQELIQSIITSKLGYTKRIYARQCTIVEVDATTEKNFFNTNHLSGHAPSKLCYGLVHNGELVMCMSFAPYRFMQVVDWEIIRIASTHNTTVVGGASKLLKQFQKRVNAGLISYADRRISKGNVYQSLGFEYVSTTNYGYGYYNKKLGKLESRHKYTKAKLVAKGYSEDLSEFEIMASIGEHYMLCDAGHLKYRLA